MWVSHWIERKSKWSSRQKITTSHWYGMNTLTALNEFGLEILWFEWNVRSIIGGVRPANSSTFLERFRTILWSSHGSTGPAEVRYSPWETSYCSIRPLLKTSHIWYQLIDLRGPHKHDGLLLTRKRDRCFGSLLQQSSVYMATWIKRLSQDTATWIRFIQCELTPTVISTVYAIGRV